MKILTFDIEDWFHILDNASTKDIHQWKSFPSRIEQGVENLLEFCDNNNILATFFILGWVAERFPDIVSEIANRGHEIACHSYGHQLVYNMTPGEFEYDLKLALDKIEAAAGARPITYRAPGFSIISKSTWAFNILHRNGIEVDCSLFPAQRAHGGIPDFPTDRPCVLETRDGSRLKIFPMSYFTLFNQKIVFSGGGYFRLLPHSFLKLAFDRSDYVMTYFHPRDFDPGQPIAPGLGRVRRFKSYVGLSSALDKLQRITDDNSFMSVNTAVQQVEWSKVQTVSLSQKGHFTI